jgi:E3 ubiquitin-protein ligase RBBP6
MHYKFKAALEHKTLTFDGLHISVGELKHLICENENIRIEWFDLVLTNASTKREYSEDEELVPRNTLVVVRRLPKKNATKLPKTQQ